MARRVRYTVQARLDLRRAAARLNHPGAGRRAQRTKERLAAALGALIDHPLRHSPVDHPGVREWPVEGHRIMYVVDVSIDADGNELAGDVTVLRVFLPRQDRARL